MVARWLDARAHPGVRRPLRAPRPASVALAAVDVEGEVVWPIPSYSCTPPFDIGPDGRMAPMRTSFPSPGRRARYAVEVVFVVAPTPGRPTTRGAGGVDYEARPAAIGSSRRRDRCAPLWDDRPEQRVLSRGARLGAVEARFCRAAHVNA